MYYGKTQKNFEEIALKFINIPENNALKTYLFHKLESIKQHSKGKDATQMTLIATWLTELYLDHLNQLKESTDPNSHYAIEVLEDEFQQFIKGYKDVLNTSMTYKLISSHGRMQELLFFSQQIEDWNLVISHYIQIGEYMKALEVMAKQNDENIYYKFSPELMFHVPHYTVNAWIKATCTLNPERLIPALMRYDPSNNLAEDKETNQAIRYLQHCVNLLGNQNPAIHNFLLSLYAKEKDETRLLNFLKQQNAYYDMKYALRLCAKENRVQSCVFLYGAMGLYEEAVDLALTVDVELAKINAEKPLEDDALKKKLWLKIARHVVERENNIKKAMELLQQCDLLKIEDILPFFPDFTQIDQFKNEICSSLEDYNHHIEELKVEMEESTRSADLIRKDIKDLRNKYAFVSLTQNCELCGYAVLSREFYVFPCQHTFHCDCLRQEVMRHMSNVHLLRVQELQQQLEQQQQHLSVSPMTATGSGASSSVHTSGNHHSGVTSLTNVFASVSHASVGAIASRLPLVGGSITNNEKDTMVNNGTVNVILSKIDKLKEELDDLLASECVLCGDIMVNSISLPFIRPDKEEADVRSWSIK